MTKYSDNGFVAVAATDSIDCDIDLEIDEEIDDNPVSALIEDTAWSPNVIFSSVLILHLTHLDSEANDIAHRFLKFCNIALPFCIARCVSVFLETAFAMWEDDIYDQEKYRHGHFEIKKHSEK